MAELTSITLTKLNIFIREGKVRSKLNCDKITGFGYFKLQTGGTWRLRYTDKLGRRRDASIADGSLKPSEAAQVALEWRSKLKQGVDPLGSIERLKEEGIAAIKLKAANKYLATGYFFESIYTPYKLDNFRAGKSTLQVIARNFSHLFNHDMDKLTSTDILSWYNKRIKAGLARSSLVRDYGAFKAMLNHAAKSTDGHTPAILRTNPIKNYNLPQPTIAEQELAELQRVKLELKRDILNSTVKLQLQNGLTLYCEQLKAKRRSSIEHGKQHLTSLDDLTYPHWFIPFYHVARLTGMRPSDIYALKWDNLVYNSFNKTTTLIFIPSKTKKANHSTKVNFPVSHELKKVFTIWQGQSTTSNSFIFPSERTGGAIERKAHLRHWKQIKALGGAPVKLEFYSFRHNFISELCARNVPVLTIAKLVGHKDGSMIAANYLRHDEKNLLKLLERVGNA